jgi:hypothetical protein
MWDDLFGFYSAELGIGIFFMGRLSISGVFISGLTRWEGITGN